MSLMGFTLRCIEKPDSIEGKRMAKWHANADGRTASGDKALGYERLITQTPTTRSGRQQVEFTTKERNSTQKCANWRDDEHTKYSDTSRDGNNRFPREFQTRRSAKREYLINGRLPG